MAWDIPYCFWAWSGFEKGADGPANHSSTFLPDMQPTLERGTAAILVAVSQFLMD